MYVKKFAKMLELPIAKVGVVVDEENHPYFCRNDIAANIGRSEKYFGRVKLAFSQKNAGLKEEGTINIIGYKKKSFLWLNGNKKLQAVLPSTGYSRRLIFISLELVKAALPYMSGIAKKMLLEKQGTTDAVKYYLDIIDAFVKENGLNAEPVDVRKLIEPKTEEIQLKLEEKPEPVKAEMTAEELATVDAFITMSITKLEELKRELLRDYARFMNQQSN